MIEFKPYPYQERVIEWTEQKDHSALLLDMGMGKSVITLTVLSKWLEEFEAFKILVVAPKRVAETVWAQEAKKWSHTSHLRLSVISGPPKRRERAVQAAADIYVIGVDNLAWLVETYPWRFDTLVIDELSMFRNMKSRRYRAVWAVRKHLTRVIGLTGTLVPKGLLDAFAPLKLIDRGEALGTSIVRYREQYFNAGRRNGHIVYDWNLKEGAAAAIYERLDKTCISLNKSDYLDLPPVRVVDLPVTLPDRVIANYKTLARDMVLDEVEAVNRGVLFFKLLQMAQGFLYDEQRVATDYHAEKLDKLDELIQSLNGRSALVAYHFKHDLERLKSKYPHGRVLQSMEDVEAWNRGEIELLFIHPKSAGHGLNLQYGGSVLVWYCLTSDLELYQQVNERLNRPGQTEPVSVYRIVATGTVDERIIPVLEQRANAQAELMEWLKLEELTL